MSKPKPGAVATVRMDLTWYIHLSEAAEHHGLSLNKYLLALTGRPVLTIHKKPRLGVTVMGMFKNSDTETGYLHLDCYRDTPPLLQESWFTPGGSKIVGAPEYWYPMQPLPTPWKE